jgi:hypothetical protein
MWVADNLLKNNPGKARNGHIVRHTIGDGDTRGFDIDWLIRGVDFLMDEATWHGSTSLFAALIGHEMGYKKIVLAGCPLDSKGHWYFPDENYGPKWQTETYQVWFEYALTDKATNVRSMSGYTAQIIGKPTEDWLNGDT